MFTPLRDILISTARSLGLETAFYLAEARSVWPEIVGGELARVCEPRSLKNGLLIVEVGHPLIGQEVLLRERGIRERFGQRVPGAHVKGVRVHLRP